MYCMLKPFLPSAECKFKKIFQENGLDQGQARHFGEPDMGSSCLQLLAADNQCPPKFGGLVQLLQRHSA